MVKTPCFHLRGVQVPSLVRELRSHVPFGMTEKKKEKRLLQILWVGGCLCPLPAGLALAHDSC